MCFIVVAICAAIGGVISRLAFPDEPGLTFIFYGSAGGLIGGFVALACYWIVQTIW